GHRQRQAVGLQLEGLPIGGEGRGIALLGAIGVPQVTPTHRAVRVLGQAGFQHADGLGVVLAGRQDHAVVHVGCRVVRDLLQDQLVLGFGFLDVAFAAVQFRQLHAVVVVAGFGRDEPLQDGAGAFGILRLLIERVQFGQNLDVLGLGVIVLVHFDGALGLLVGDIG